MGKGKVKGKIVVSRSGGELGVVAETADSRVQVEQRRIFDEQLSAVFSNARDNTAFLSRGKHERIVEIGGKKVLCYTDKKGESAGVSGK
ncbi:MAG: hypothetical protein SGPRY_009406, partial [Prymnesium sp.]